MSFLIYLEQKQSLPKADNSILYMNSTIMKTLKYKKGSLVIIFTEQGQLLFRCRLNLLLESSAIMLPSINFFQDYLNGYVRCDFYSLPLYLCDMVILNCDAHKSFMESNSFKKFLKAELGMLYFNFIVFFIFLILHFRYLLYKKTKSCL